MNSDGGIPGSPDMEQLFEHYRRHQFVADRTVFDRQLVVHGLLSQSPDVAPDTQRSSNQAYQLVGNMHAHLCSLGWMNRNPALEELPDLEVAALQGMSLEEANRLLVKLGCFQKLTSTTVDANLRPDLNHPLPDNTPRDVWSGIRNAQPTQSLPDYISRARYLLEAMYAARGK